MTPDKTAAEKILAADFRNIIKKVKAGTPLSKSERDIVKHWEAEQPKPTPKASNAKSKQAVPPAKEAAQRIVESMQAAASLVGYRIEAIQAAKAAGCVAFKPGNRINLFELEEWFALHPEVTSVNQSDMTIAQALTMETVAKALTRRENYARMRRDLVRAEEMRLDVTRAFVGFRAKLLSIASSVSQKLALVSDANTIDVELRTQFKMALAELHKSKWAGCDCPHCGKEISRKDLK